MKKFFFSWIETFAIGGLMIGAILAFISFVSLSLYVFADVKPYIVTGSFFIGAIQFEKGIPVRVELNYKFPETDLRRDTISIRTRYEHWPAAKDYYIDGASVNNGIVYVQTESVPRKLEFLLPQLLSLLVGAYCMWQIGLLLHSITKQAAFETLNFTRLRNVGWAIILCQLALLTTQSQTKAFDLFIVMSGYYYPDLHFITWSEAPFSLTWLLIGAIILILALAFKRGTQLQLDQEYTV